MERKEILALIFNHFRTAGMVKTQGDFAKMLGITRESLCAALAGKERYMTDGLMYRAAALYEDTFGCPLGQAPVGAIPMQKDELLVIPTGARGGTIGDFAASVKEYDCERIISPIKGADFAIQVTGDSMAPEYPNGSKIIIKKVDAEQFIEWGKVYVLDTPNGAVVKRIMTTADADKVACESINLAFPTFEVNKSFITGWYRVLMMLALK